MSLPVEIPESLAPLQEFLADALARVEARFDLQLRSDLPPVSKLCAHIERYRGKMLRPTLAILAGLAAHPRAADAPPGSIITEDHLLIAAVCEMVHMATLVHDDVLDEAETRRRGRTVNRLYGNEAAVILGDYLIASAYHLCSQLADQAVALEVARVSMTLCAGELLQLHHRRPLAQLQADHRRRRRADLHRNEPRDGRRRRLHRGARPRRRFGTSFAHPAPHLVGIDPVGQGHPGY